MTEINNTTKFHHDLKNLMNWYAHKVYDITSTFPRDEHFGLTSQLRRSSLSVILNYIEGFARQRKSVLKNFLEISYGSLKESKYLLHFSYKRKWTNKQDYMELRDVSETIGKMIWGILKKL